MNKSLDKFRFKAWVKPDPYVRYLTENIYKAEARNQVDSWIWKEPGHLYCLIYLSLFGHHVDPKYRCLAEAYQRCDFGGFIVVLEKLSTTLKKIEPADGAPIAKQLLVALMLCGVKRAGARNRSKVTARGALRDVILGELQASVPDRSLLTEDHIKAALSVVNKEKSRFNEDHPGKPDTCSSLSPTAAEMFPDTFNKADKKALERTKNGSMETLKVPKDPHSEWQRIAAGPHPLSIFETAWILVHFKLRDVHSAGF